MHLLDQDLPGVAGRLETLSQEARKRVLGEICRFVASMMEGDDAQVVPLLDALSGPGDREVKARAAKLAEEADDRYFDLQEQGAEEDEWMRWFSRARLLHAIARSIGATTAADAAEALYELCHATEKSSTLLAMLDGLLKEAQRREERPR